MTPCMTFLQVSANAGISIMLISVSHNAGVICDGKSPKVFIIDKKNIVSRLLSE